jgi:hypothetical protein
MPQLKLRTALLTEGAEETVEEYLRLAFFVAGDVRGGPIDEVLKERFSGLPAVCPHCCG